MAGRVINPGRGPQPAHVEAEMSTIATELEALVDHIDDESRGAGKISKESAQRLEELRLRFEALFRKPLDHRDRWLAHALGTRIWHSAAQLEGFLKQSEISARRANLQTATTTSLAQCLTAYLLAVEAARKTEMLTSILLLERWSRRGVAKLYRLPARVCSSAVDGIKKLGPRRVHAARQRTSVM